MNDIDTTELLYSPQPDYDSRTLHDPVFFIESKVKIAGFPLLLSPEIAEFIYQLNRETEITSHNVGRGHGLTTGILAFLVWKAYTRPGTRHIIVSPRYEETMERLIHVAAMARSIGPGVVRNAGIGIEFENGSVIEGVSATALSNAGRGLSIRAATLALDGFGSVKASTQAEIAYRLSTDLSGKFKQTILV